MKKGKEKGVRLLKSDFSGVQSAMISITNFFNWNNEIADRIPTRAQVSTTVFQGGFDVLPTSQTPHPILRTCYVSLPMNDHPTHLQIYPFIHKHREYY